MKKATLILLSLTITLTAGWWRTYGGEGRDVGYCVREVEDNGFIISGFSESRGGVWIIKTDNNGGIVWDTIFESPYTWDRNCVQITSDGGYIIAYTGSIVKIKKGDIIWGKTVGWSASWIEETKDGGYIVTGSIEVEPGHEEPGTDATLLKIDSQGNTEWLKTFGEHWWGYYSWGNCVQQTFDGGYVIACGNDDYGGWIIKTDSVGNFMWDIQRESWEYYFVRQTEDHGYVASGRPGFVLLKADSLGEIEWRKQYRESGGYGYCVQQTKDGGYIVSGGSWGTDPWTFFKVDTLGDTLWVRNCDAIGYNIEETSDSGFILVGRFDDWDNPQIYLLKTDSLGNLAIEETMIPETQPTFEAVTAVGEFVLLSSQSEERSQLGIFDASGRLVDEVVLEGRGTISWGEGFSPGVYFIVPQTGNQPAQKVILVR